ncbi:hypothetical protein BT69DRAFT_1280832, partial [Atractiella rhizophila]
SPWSSLHSSLIKANISSEHSSEHSYVDGSTPSTFLCPPPAHLPTAPALNESGFNRYFSSSSEQVVK